MRHGIQLVVVALRAGNGGGDKPLAHRVNNVGGCLLRDALGIGIVPVPPLAEPHRHGAKDGFVQTGARIHARRADKVTRNLLEHELLEGHVGVERADQVVAIHPGVLRRGIPLVAVGVGVMHHVHPMPCPTLAEVRAVEQRLHQLVVSARRGARGETLHVLRLGWQSRECKTQPAGERAAIGFAGGLQTFGFKGGEDEIVHLVPWPRFILHLRRPWFGNRLKTPPRQAVAIDRFPFLARGFPRRCGAGDQRTRIGCAPLHPLDQHGDFRIREFFLRRHLQILVGILDRRDEAASFRRPRDQRGPALATAFPTGARIQRQPALDLLPVGVALVAARDQQRLDFRLEKVFIRARRRLGSGRRRFTAEPLQANDAMLDEAGRWFHRAWFLAGKSIRGQFPDDLFVARDLENLDPILAGFLVMPVRVRDEGVAIGEAMEAAKEHHGKFGEVGRLQLPNHAMVRRDFDDAAAPTHERVPVRQPFGYHGQVRHRVTPEFRAGLVHFDERFFMPEREQESARRRAAQQVVAGVDRGFLFRGYRNPLRLAAALVSHLHKFHALGIHRHHIAIRQRDKRLQFTRGVEPELPLDFAIGRQFPHVAMRGIQVVA